MIKKKRILILLVVGFIAIVLIVIGITASVKSKEEKKLNSVLLNTLSVSKERWETIDPTKAIRYALNNKINSSTIEELGLRKNDILSHDDTLVYELNNKKEYAIKSLKLTFDISYNLIEIDCQYENNSDSYSNQYNKENFTTLTATIEKLINSDLEWYNDGIFYSTSELKDEIKYVCIPDIKPSFIKLTSDEQGNYEIKYKFGNDNSFETYKSIVENSQPLNYDTIEQIAVSHSLQNVVFSGNVVNYQKNGMFNFAYIHSKNGSRNAFFEVWCPPSDFISDLKIGDEITVYASMMTPEAAAVFPFIGGKAFIPATAKIIETSKR